MSPPTKHGRQRQTKHSFYGSHIRTKYESVLKLYLPISDVSYISQLISHRCLSHPKHHPPRRHWHDLEHILSIAIDSCKINIIVTKDYLPQTEETYIYPLQFFLFACCLRLKLFGIPFLTLSIPHKGYFTNASLALNNCQLVFISSTVPDSYPPPHLNSKQEITMLFILIFSSVF